MTLRWMALGLIHAVVELHAIDIVVDYLTDDVGILTACTPEAGHCNIRSAWELCSQFADQQCNIVLAANSSHTMNATNGNMELLDGSMIHIHGNGAQITSGDDSSMRRRALVEDHSSKIILSTVTNDFPIQTAVLTDTNYAMQNYATACVWACPLDVLTFSSCNEIQDTDQDTYFMLFNADGTYVTENDEACGHSSEITYYVPYDSECQDYCLHIGCYESLSCTAYVTFQRGSQLDSLDMSNRARFIHHVQNSSASSAVAMSTMLTLQDVTFSGFGATGGGVIFIDGDVQLTITDCRFDDTVSILGGAMYVTQNAQAVRIENTTFANSQALHGGAIYIGSNVNNLTIDHCVFRDCTALLMGGAVMLDSNNIGAKITYSEFQYCSAALSGGGLAINEHNNGFTVVKTVFLGCKSDFEGGGIHIDSENTHGNIISCLFHSCTAVNRGGGVSMRMNNEDIAVTNTVFQHCEATLYANEFIGGGGVYMRIFNKNITIADCMFDHCTGGFSGGGILVAFMNEAVTVKHNSFMECSSVLGGGVSLVLQNNGTIVSDNTFTRCRVSYNGAGLFVYYTNTGVQVLNSLFEDCYAWYVGGGLHIVKENTGAFVFNVTVRNCVALNQGGGMIITSSADVRIADLLIENCTSHEGGGIYVDSTNSNLQLSGVTITNCTSVGNGAGIYFGRSNYHVRLTEVVLDNCATVRGNGGGLYLGSQNNFMTLEDVIIIECSAMLGGGIYSLSNTNLAITDCLITECTATEAGGAINLHAHNSEVTILRSNLTHNRAGEDGGGIASESRTQHLVIVGSTLHGNHAARNGGGIHLSSGNAGFALLDTPSFEGRAILESEHPYEFVDGNVVQSVSVPGAVGYYVFFDAKSEIAESDYCFIEAPLGTQVFKSYEDSWPGISVPPLLLNAASITLTFSTNRYGQGSQTTKQDNYYGIRLNVVPIFADNVGPVILSGNTAGESGGGLFMFSGVTFSTLIGAQFVNNEAGNGGGMFLRNAIVGLIAHQLSFLNNKAWDEDGGGVTVSSASYGLLFRYCSFTNNSAGGSGGALAFISNNGVDGDLDSSDVNQVLGCTFLRNRAVSHGGAIYVGAKSALLIASSMITESISGGDGGGVMLNEGSTLTATSVDVYDNLARQCGGAVALGQQNQATISQSVLHGNTATYSGGALCAKSLSQYVLTDLTVTGCRAGKYGGAMSCVGSLPPVLVRSVLSNNTAVRGSALYLHSVAATSAASLGSGKQVEMAHNHAVVGTIYWVNGSMAEPVALKNASSYSENTAQFGRELATQAVLLRVPRIVHVRKYGAFLEPTVITLYDTYGQVAPANAPAYVQVGILGASADQCGGRFPFLSGADVDSAGVPLVDGQAVFSSLEGACSPGGSVTLLFTAHLSDQPALSDDQQTVYATTQLRFRTCVAGEVILNGKCVECPYGSYSLEANVTESTTCTECQSLMSVESCEGSVLVVRQGNWRRYPETEAVLPCLSEVSGCAGGNATGDASCLIGFEGPLCSLCSEGYFLSEKTCLPCQDSDQLGPASILFLVVAVIAVAGVLAFLFYKSSRAYSGNAVGVLQSLYEVGTWITQEMQGLGSQLKIVITTFQICTTIPVSMNVTFPPQFARFLDSMSFFNLNLLSAVPLSCASDRTYTFIDKLVMVTLAPIGLSLLLLLCCIVESAHNVVRAGGGMSEETKENITKVVTRYLTMFLFLTYLVLPFVSTTIFRTYLCTNVDPNQEDADGSDSFLTADMRISCNSEYYQRGVIYASFMVAVYVVGIPLLYTVLLYHSRREITERYIVPVSSAANTKTEVELAVDADQTFHPADHNTHSGEGEPENQLKHRHDRAAHQALMISFLYEAYEPKYWYWEVVETTRRLVLTAVLSVCGAGTAGQAILALLLALACIKIYGHFKPYEQDVDDTEAEVGQFQIFLTFLGALIFQRQLLGEEWNGAVGGVLIAINTSVSALFARNVIMKLHADIRKYRRVAPNSEKTNTGVWENGMGKSGGAKHSLHATNFNEGEAALGSVGSFIVDKRRADDIKTESESNAASGSKDAAQNSLGRGLATQGILAVAHQSTLEGEIDVAGKDATKDTVSGGAGSVRGRSTVDRQCEKLRDADTV